MLCKFSLEALAAIRKEWEFATGNDTSLLEVSAPVGLLLADVCQSLSLEPADRLQVLVFVLYSELQVVEVQG
jgi:hypothetical protein